MKKKHTQTFFYNQTAMGPLLTVIYKRVSIQRYHQQRSREDSTGEKSHRT